MTDAFKSYLRQKGWLTESRRFLLAVSGGVDSMVMLDLYRQTMPAGTYAVAHCNFQLRDQESESDQQLVEAYCSEYGIELYVRRFETVREAEDRAESIQMAARRLRYEWFDELCGEFGYDYVAIAHHIDDSVETFFINLMRGTGLRGLTGIPSDRGRIIRPLLFAGREEISNYAAQRGIRFRNDSSNDSNKYLRNRLRHEIIPMFSSSSSHFGRTMEENLSRLQQTQQYIDTQIRELRRRAIRDNRLLLIELSAENLSFELHELLSPFGFPGEVIADLAALIHRAGVDGVTASGKQFVSENWTATVDRQAIILTERADEPLREEWIEKDDPRIEWLSLDQVPASLRTPSNVAYLCADALSFPLHLRRWQEGDWFIPLGLAGQKKVSDFLIDNKVPLPEKARQRVLTSGPSIIWLTGRRIDDRYKVTERSQKVIKITL